MTPQAGCMVALIPAAGRSRRMGQPKLLLRLGGETVIQRLVTTLAAAEFKPICVLVRSDDLPLQQALAALPCETIVAAAEPAEMRDSVELLLAQIQQRPWSAALSHWLLVPADHPIVEPAVLKRLRSVAQAIPEQIVVPVHGGQRGHPTLLPWNLAGEVHRIPADRGLNWLIRSASQRVIEVPCSEPSVLFDLDTPEDYARARQLIHPADGHSDRSARASHQTETRTAPPAAQCDPSR